MFGLANSSVMISTMVMMAFDPSVLWTLLPIGGVAAAVYTTVTSHARRTRYRLYRLCGWSRAQALRDAIVRKPQ